jgi:curved DNA-binding protein CbpA
MASPKPTPDPYRVLEILRGADAEQIKAAHRRLAKLHHPDRTTGDEERFLAVQEAYQLLSDPLRRREWDSRHAPGPVRASSSRRTGQARTPSFGADRTRSRTMRSARGRRTPDERRQTWSAERVPWWEDFRPGGHRPRPDAGPADERPSDLDVFDRSSGAAWSSAARKHFRRGTEDLPSRGVWRYRGTQVVTGAEARKVAAEEEEEDRRR